LPPRRIPQPRAAAAQPVAPISATTAATALPIAAANALLTAASKTTTARIAIFDPGRILFPYQAPRLLDPKKRESLSSSHRFKFTLNNTKQSADITAPLANSQPHFAKLELRAYIASFGACISVN
jgi:hypothetical protein